jgi:hypothetical protein
MDRTYALRVIRMTFPNLGDLSFARGAFRFCFARMSREKFAKMVAVAGRGHALEHRGFRVDTLPIEEWTIRQNGLESQRS